MLWVWPLTARLSHKTVEAVRLMTLLKSLCKASDKHIKSLLQRGLCTVNGEKERFSSRLLEKGDYVDFLFKPEIPAGKPRLLFEDSDIAAYDKPPFMSSLEVAEQLRHLKLLHRLDKETSGVLLFAKKDPKPFLKLFKSREVGKGYVALVDGIIKEEEGVIKKPLAPLKRFAGQVVMGVSSEGLFAETHYTVKKRYKDKTLLLCRPITGRTHQIRIHMQSIGHPVLGDYHYGTRFKCKDHPPRIMLHAAFIRILDHLIQAPLPEDFKACM